MVKRLIVLAGSTKRLKKARRPGGVGVSSLRASTRIKRATKAMINKGTRGRTQDGSEIEFMRRVRHTLRKSPISRKNRNFLFWNVFLWLLIITTSSRMPETSTQQQSHKEP
jgi:hypothetical protein